MSYFLITAMHQDWCHFSQSRLIEMGALPAKDDPSDAFNLNELIDKLSKAHKVSTERSTKFRQITPGQAWHISASSVIVENADHENWCWGHPNNVFFLDFWKDLDPLCQFILVYGSFEDYLTRQSKIRNFTQKNKEVLSARWKSYHAEMLRFYNRNRDRCLLMHIQAFESQTSEVSRLMFKHFDTKLRNINSIRKMDRNSLELLLALKYTDEINDGGIIDIANEIENSADIQHDVSTLIETLANDTLEQFDALESRQMQLQTELSQLTNKHETARQENKLLMAQLHQLQAELELYFKKSTELEKRSKEVSQQEQVDTRLQTQKKIEIHDQTSSEDIKINFSNYISGNGWHNAEDTGRWAGNTVKSSLFVKGLSAQDYDLEIRVLDGMSLEILENLELLVNGKPLKTFLKKLSDLQGTLAPLRRLKAGISQMEKPYPALLSATIPQKLIDSSKISQTIEFIVPQVRSPSKTGSSDTRYLSLFYETMRLSPKS